MPQCKTTNRLKSKGNEFFCACGLRGKYDVFGGIRGKGFTFRSIKDWDIWQRGAIANLKVPDQQTVLCSDPNQYLMEVSPDHSTRRVAYGELSLTPSRLTIGQWSSSCVI